MQSLTAWLRLGLELARALPAGGARRLPRRLLLFPLLWLTAGALMFSHGVGMALDRLLFPGYRRLAVRRPVFILGVPRSGTTYLQRQLARDPAFTSLSLWECLLAPSITERYLWLGIGRLLSPLEWLARRWRWTALDRVHRLAWQDPEEDFLLLLARSGCFLPALLCPGAERYWRLAWFDRALPAVRRRAIMDFYYGCLQRHLYFHGAHRRLLSKNPSWTGWLDSLRERFPDARFIACVRRPREAVPSQLSALRPALTLLGQWPLAPAVRDRLLAVLHSQYRQINANRRAGDVRLLPLPELSRLGETGWQSLYAFIGEPPPSANRPLEEARPDARPGHRYRLSEWGLSAERVDWLFGDVWSEARAKGGSS